MLINKRKLFNGFTLIELLVVMAILGILATVALTSFASAQARSRDSKRKSDLKQIATALELYYSDYATYPSPDSGKILGCPSAGTPLTCDWGVDGSRSEFTDGKTTYMKIVPKDPSGYNYYYRTVTVGSDRQGFQLFAHLENTQDQALITPAYSCTGQANSCNFAITSPNVTATD